MNVTSLVKLNYQAFILCLLVFSPCLQADLNDQIAARITQAKNELDTLEKKTAQESRAYAQRLEQKEQEVKNLRSQVAATQRLADEQLLSVDKLKERVEKWNAQSLYQKQLLSHYAETAKLTALAKPDNELAILDAAAKELEQALNPAWQQRQVASQGGSIIDAAQLALGPITFAIDEKKQFVGPVLHEHAQQARILDLLPAAAQSEIINLHSSGTGVITFDPTLGNVMQLRKHSDGLWVYLQKGGVWVIPIISFGLIALLIATIKAVQLLRLPRVDLHLAEQLGHLLAQKQADVKSACEQLLTQASPAQRKLSHIALNNPISQLRDDLLVASLSEQKHWLEKHMGVVATSASVAPLLGLLGTVSGMITTFKMMTIFGSGDVSTVSGGISEALITTELGLIVAVPSLVIGAILSRQIKTYGHNLESFAIKISKVAF